MLAAGVIHAVDNHRQLLASTHALAKRLGDGLSGAGVEVTRPVQTNMVWAKLGPGAGFESWVPVSERLEKRGIRIGQGSAGGNIRFVLHFQCNEEGVDAIIEEVRAEQGKK